MLTRRALLAAPALLVLPQAAFAASPSVYNEGGIAIDGTDPTGYFTQGKPVAGEPSITLDWSGVTWRFASADSRALFERDPTRFSPQFGGYCAWAVSQGYTASTIPEAWKIVDDRLYLNFNRRIQRRWERDIPGNIARGNANWPDVLSA